MHPGLLAGRNDQAIGEGVLSTLPLLFKAARCALADYSIVHLHGRAKRDYLSAARISRC
jgi:hypothetical protein